MGRLIPRQHSRSQPNVAHYEGVSSEPVTPVTPLSALAPRGRLLEESLRGGHSAALVQAPAGWGKTTLLRQWASRHLDEVSFLSCDDADEDPAVLIGRLLSGLDGAQAPTGRVLAGPVSDREFLTAVTMPRLLAYWTARSQPVTLVLDDVSGLSNPASWDVISSLVETSDPSRKVVLSGRTKLPLRAAHLIADQRLVSVGPRQLALDSDQAAELFTACGARVGRIAAEVLVRRTGGWPVALSLAALRLAASDNEASVVEGFSGADPEMSLYFSEEVLADLPAELLHFLERTSILSSLRVDICDAVDDDKESAVMLAELERRLLVLPSVIHRGAFRHHPMLRDMLTDRLTTFQPEIARLSHRRAAICLSRSGDTEVAIRDARESGDQELLGSLVWRAAGDALSCGRRHTVETWLRSLEDREVLASPALALTMAWCSLEAGRHIQPWFSAAEQGLRARGPHADRSLRCGLGLLAAATATDGVPGILTQAQQAYQLASPDDPWRSMACYLIGTAHHLNEDNREARRWLEEGEQLGRLLPAPLIRALCLARQAAILLDEGDWEGMSSLAFSALGLVEQYELLGSAPMSAVLAISALAQAHDGRQSEAVANARQAARLLSYLEVRLPWLTYEVKVVLGKAYLLLGDVAAARHMLAEAQTVGRGKFQSRHLRRLLDEEWSMATAAPLTTTVGPSALTTAELRVLQLLQTHLSFQEIGDALFLSRNTVKTQAIAAYRKLGVRSRSEAVETGRQLGLLVHAENGLQDLHGGRLPAH